ncbi:MAG: TolC family protein [Aquabacterium sp.]|nr:MAG: TolC family protein [Aquabacterium sp.]
MRKLLLHLSWLLATAAHAQPADPPSAASLTLDQAVEIVLARHPELSAARHELDAARGTSEQAAVLPNPELEASVEDTRRATQTTALQLRQRLELGGKRAARVQAAQAGEAIAALQLDARGAGLRASVQAAYWELQTAQARRDLARQSQELARQAADVASRRVSAGKVSPIEQTRAQLALSGVELEGMQAEQEWLSARARLAALLGSTPAQLPALSGTPPLPSALRPDELESRLDAAPELQLARLELRRREAGVELERSKAVPDLTVGIGAQRDNELRRTQALLGVAMPLPVFDRNQGGLREALARADQSRDELAAVRQRLLAEVQSQAAQLDAARSQALLVQQRMLPDAQQAYEAATLGFSLGKFGFLDVLDAQRTLFQARAQHLRALADAQRAACELQRRLGPATDHRN